VAHVEHSLRYIERVEDHLSELDRHFLLLLQDRTNNRLRILTIISASLCLCMANCEFVP